MIPALGQALECVELSIYYFRLTQNLADNFPAYYILCHDPALTLSRIVNYSAYGLEAQGGSEPVLAVEVTHPVGAAPAMDQVARELRQVLPSASILDSYKLPGALRVPVPSLRNAMLLDDMTAGLSGSATDWPVYFTGMRTDRGIFFSHHTIGLSYDAAVECAARLS